jgi:protein-tyrosine kinase
VLSAGVGEGKSFFAANLAVAFSQLGARTLLIDADMRTPRLHRMFGLDGEAGRTGGLSAILSGRSQASVVRPAATLPSLYLLPVGAAPPNPSELVQRPSFAAMLKGALRNFEYVIVDTPAAWHGPDARVIASRCGAALAIGRRDRTPIGKLQQLIEQVTKNTERFAGVVMNDF